MYQVMVESFIDGAPNANYDTGYGRSHHKGDLKGITSALDHIQSTGANALWITPIFESTPLPGQDSWADRLDATGYFSSDFFKVDPHFGTEDDLRMLIGEVHARGMYLFLDGVFGHYKINLASRSLPDGTVLRPTNRSNCLSDGNGSTFNPGSLHACPDWSSADTAAFFEEVATFWIREYGVDGWRLDQAYQVPPAAWARLRNAVIATSAAAPAYPVPNGTRQPLGYMVAEVWKGESDIAAWAYGSDTRPALASAFDFPTRYRLVATLASEESGKTGQPAPHLASFYGTLGSYPSHAMPNLMLGNHDLVRFGDLLQRGRVANPEEELYWRRHEAAFTFMAAYSGPITLYYGEEIGQELPSFADRVTDSCAWENVCDDHVSRISGRVTGLTSREDELRRYAASGLKLRDEHPALSVGTATHVYSDDALYVDLKEAPGSRVLLVINVKNTEAAVRFSTVFLGADRAVDLLSGEELVATHGMLEVRVPGSTGRLLGL